MGSAVNLIEFGDCRATMRRWAEQGIKAQTCVTSPPYFGLRDYKVDGQIGLEKTPEEFIAALVEVFRCVRDVLADDGTLWLNLGDSYNGHMANQRGTGLEAGRQQSRKYIEPGAGLRTSALKNKDLIGIPWRVAFALQADGWYLRQDIIWHKPNPMPESVTDRCTKAHEYIFLFSKSPRYYFDNEAIKEAGSGRIPGNKKPTAKRGGKVETAAEGHGIFAAQQMPCETRNRRSVWTVSTKPYSGAHFATFPPALIEPCILAGSRPGDIVLDPFMGSGTTAAVAMQHGRQYLGCELNPEYEPLQDRRIAEAGQTTVDMFAEAAR